MDKWIVILKEEEEDEEHDLLDMTIDVPDKKILETVLKYVFVVIKIYFTL